MGHRGGVLDESLHAAKAYREGRDVYGLDEPPPRAEPAPRLEAQHRSEAGHLPPREAVLGEGLQPGVVDDADRAMVLEELRERLCVRALRSHADREGLHPAPHEERLERSDRGAEELVREPDPVEEPGRSRHDRARDDVAVATEILRRAVDHRVDPVLERALVHGRRERVVREHGRADGSRGCDVERVAEVDTARAADPGRILSHRRSHRDERDGQSSEIGRRLLERPHQVILKRH